MTSRASSIAADPPGDLPLSPPMRSPVLQPILRFLLLTLALLAVQVAFFTALPTIAWRFAAADAAIGPIRWLVPLPVFIWLILALVHLRASSAAPRIRRAVRTPPALVLPAFIFALAIAVNTAMQIAAARVHAHVRDRHPHIAELASPPDLSRLFGQCIRLSLLRHTAGLPASPDRTALERLASTFPERWTALAAVPEPLAAPFGDPAPAALLASAGAASFSPALQREQLAKVLRTLAIEPPSADVLTAAAAALAADQGLALRAAMRADFENHPQDRAALQLDFLTRWLACTPASMSEGRPAITAALLKVKGLLAADAAALPALHRRLLELRAAADPHAQRVAADFTTLAAAIAAVQPHIDQPATSAALFTAIMQIDADAACTAADRRARLMPLLIQLVAISPAGPPRIRVPPPVQQAVSDAFADVPCIERYTALARAGLDRQAVFLTAEIDRTLPAASTADQRAYFAARGDFCWVLADFHQATMFYTRALAMGQADPAMLARAARCASQSSSNSTFEQDLQTVQSRVEHALATLAADPEPRTLDRARLHIALATILAAQHRSAEANAAGRTAMKLLQDRLDAPASATCMILADAAAAFNRARTSVEAFGAADRAVAAASAVDEDAPRLRALAAAARASLRPLRADLATAESDIQSALDWARAQSPPDTQALSHWHALRAFLGMSFGNAERAEQDYTAAIAAAHAQEIRIPRHLCMLHAMRGTVRETLKDLAGAEADATTALELESALPDADRRLLTSIHTQRYRLREAQGNLPGAESDITACIDWCRAQPQADLDRLLQHLRSRASIRISRGHLPGAAADIQSCIDALDPQDSRQARTLAQVLTLRAVLRQRERDLPGAEADLRWSMDWLESQRPTPEIDLARTRAARARLREAQALAARAAGNQPEAATRFAQAAADIAASIAWFEQFLPGESADLTAYRADQSRIAASAAPPTTPERLSR